MEEYQGPVPATEKEYLIAIYSKLSHIEQKVLGALQDIGDLRKDVENLKSTQRMHNVFFAVLGLLSSPMIILIGNFILSHLNLK